MLAAGQSKFESCVTSNESWFRYHHGIHQGKLPLDVATITQSWKMIYYCDLQGTERDNAIPPSVAVVLEAGMKSYDAVTVIASWRFFPMHRKMICRISVDMEDTWNIHRLCVECIYIYIYIYIYINIDSVIIQ